MGCCVSRGSVQTAPLDPLVVSIFGPDNAGKTCLLRALSGDFDFDTVPSVGLGQKTFMYDDVKMTFYDLGGHSKFRNVWTRFYAESWGCLFVVDSSDPARFAETKEILEGLREHKMMKGKPIVVVANKQDLPNALSSEELRKALEIPDDVPVYEAIATSVVDGKCNQGVNDATNALITTLVQNHEKLRVRVEQDMKEQEEIERKEREEKLERVRKRQAEKSEASEN